MDPKLLQSISEIVAECLNEDRAGDLKTELDKVFGPDATAREKLAALGLTPIYSLVAEQPGYPEDGKPGFYPVGSNLKAAVLNEINAMIEADFEASEHRQIWQKIRESVAATPEGEFLPGIAVNCPDDYLLTLDKRVASEVLRRYKALPDWT